MIVQLTGNINYSITLDPSVWIFDDRKIKLADAFNPDAVQEEVEEKLRTADQLNAAIYEQNVKPPVNNTVKKYDREELLSTSYVMPIKEFIEHAEVKEDAEKAILISEDAEYMISLEQLKNCYLLFSIDGKPIKENGPVHVYLKDGSNQDEPFTSIKKIIIQ
ncbi:hypothetical protein AB4Y30_06605 [Ornithinibacillus sp. 4-3]|uniref:Peptidyl-prolyl cis-trans isomerase n=1 Tax=Ornithinibacillus sp. 4-3 TaxID=3231488 RepID=A0AB39HRI4_9BACI